MFVSSTINRSVFQKNTYSLRGLTPEFVYHSLKVFFFLSLSLFFKTLAFLTFHMKDFATDTWIGLNDINHELRFLWTDGTGVYFTNWAKGFPSGHMGFYSYDGQVNSNHKPTAEICF